MWVRRTASRSVLVLTPIPSAAQNYVALLQPRFLGAEVFRDGIDHRVGRTVGKFRLLHIDANRGQAVEASGGDDIIDDRYHTAGRDGKSQALPPWQRCRTGCCSSLVC